jgi:hypothetical protein
LAPVPARTYSQSSGWAPKTMMRSLSEAMESSISVEGEELADLSAVGRRPYSQISNASAKPTFAASSLP